MAVIGMKAMLNSIDQCFEQKRMEALTVAAEMSAKAIRQFHQHQFAALHEPDGKAKAETSGKKAAARQYVSSHTAVTAKETIGEPWINRSFRSARTVFADYGQDDKGLFFNLYHTMSYGAYLELGKDRKYAVLEPIVRGLAPEFLNRLKEIYAGN